MAEGQRDSKEQENIYAGRLLMVVAGQVSDALTVFTSYVIAGFGAALGLLIANLESVGESIEMESIRHLIIVLFVHLHHMWYSVTWQLP